MLLVASTMHMASLMRARERFGSFELVAPLASGGMGGVYLARHVTSGERVALKVLDPLFANHAEVVARLFSEHAISSSVSHAGLLEVRAAARTPDGVPYLVMEYLEGKTLATIANGEPLDIATIVDFGSQIASALAALHEAGIMHCDVKPQNVFVVEGLWQHTKVIDFGVSRFVGEPAPDEATIAGTPTYMAPEQWKGAPRIESDVYAFGCMLYELVTGEPPFDGSLPQLMLAHLEARPPRPTWSRRGLPIELERVILRALAKDPELRPTMSELAITLGELADVMLAGETLRMSIAV
jgi:serine/threonine-protein kinase